MPNRIVQRIIAALLLSATLAACASGPSTPRSRVPGGEAAEAMLERAEVRRRALPTQGEPGLIAAIDRRFARTAQQEGQWSAFRQFAAAGALLHMAHGPQDAGQWLAGRADPPQSVGWWPTAVWASCDGTLAISFGRYIEPTGIVGSYATVWTLQGDGEYRWAYDMGGPDNPQPPLPAPRAEPDINTIVVPAIDVIDGRVADCRRGGALPPAPSTSPPDGAQGGGGRSADGTLQWRWEHRPDGTRRILADYLRNGRWEQAIDFTMPSEGARR